MLTEQMRHLLVELDDLLFKELQLLQCHLSRQRPRVAEKRAPKRSEEEVTRRPIGLGDSWYVWCN
jgi:hypothetical protein